MFVCLFGAGRDDDDDVIVVVVVVVVVGFHVLIFVTSKISVS